MSDGFDYGALAQRIIQAQTAFRQTYEMLNPYPVKPPQEARRDWLMRGLLVIPMVGAAIVSGDHTVTTYAHDKPVIVGIAAFAMLEVMLFVASFYVTREKYRSRHEEINVVAYMGKGIVVSYVVLLLGNFSDVMVSHGFAEGSFWTGFSLVISTGIALSAPTIALIVGHMQAMLFVQDMAVDKRAALEYEAICKAWQEQFDAAWKAQKHRWGASVAVSVEIPKVSNGIPLENPLENQAVLPSKSSIGHSKAPDASKKVREYFEANPDQLQGNAIEIARYLNVGKSTVYALMKEMKQ